MMTYQMMILCILLENEQLGYYLVRKVHYQEPFFLTYDEGSDSKD